MILSYAGHNKVTTSALVIARRIAMSIRQFEQWRDPTTSEVLMVVATWADSKLTLIQAPKEGELTLGPSAARECCADSNTGRLVELNGGETARAETDWRIN